MPKFKIDVELNKKDLKALDKDLDRLFTDMGRQLASAPNMQPVVSKMRQGMTENAMQFSNHPIWEANKQEAKEMDIINFDSPLMTTGQMVDDFIYHAGKPKISQIPYSDDFVIGMLTWAAKERKRPTARHILNEISRKTGSGRIEETEKFTYIKTNELVKMIMKSPRYPIMDSLASLYHKDILLHAEKLIDKAFKAKR